MIRVLSDGIGDCEGRTPIQILDLRGLSFDEAETELEALHRDSFGHPKWDAKSVQNIGLRIVIEWHAGRDGFKSEEPHPLEDQSDRYHGLNPKYGFAPIWALMIDGGTGDQNCGMMYVVRPIAKPRQGLMRLIS